MTKICLSIAGLDPSGGAGVIADVKAFEAFGCFAAAAVSSITFQNTTGVFGAVHSSADTVRQQVQPIIDDYTIAAVKTGMLPTREVILEVARLIRDNALANIVVDPVVRSTSGFDLIDNAALQDLIKHLFPLADLITPNIPEAERISGIAIESEEDIIAAAKVMQEMGARNVLIKGGHFTSAARGEQRAESVRRKIATGHDRTATDYLFLSIPRAAATGQQSVPRAVATGHDLSEPGAIATGFRLVRLDGEYHQTSATHGTGCTLSSAIAANLALGHTLTESVRIAKALVNQAIKTAPNLGHGNSPINIKPWSA